MNKRLIAFGAPLALAACSLAPRTELPTPPVSPSWPIGDAYLAIVGGNMLDAVRPGTL